MRPARWLLLGLISIWSLSHADLRGGEKREATPAERIRASLDRPITVDFSGQSLREAIEHLREKTNLPLSFDQVTLAGLGITPDDVNGPVQIRATEEKAGQVLRKVLNAYRLAPVIIDDALLITTEDGALHRQLRQRVDVDVSDVPFQKAARDVARGRGINLVIDPRVAKQAQTPVTLQIEGVPLETAIRVMAEMVDVKLARFGNVLFVTTEERAQRVRREGSPSSEDPIAPAQEAPRVVPAAPVLPPPAGGAAAVRGWAW